MKKFRFFALLILPLFLIVSCTSQKKSYKVPLKEKGEEYLISKMQESESQFKTLKSKAIVQITNKGKTNDLKVNIRIRKDSAIWVSISAGMGLELARILLTKDSVLFINRLEKNFFSGNYKFINQLINAQVDFDIVQALLTGNDIKWYSYQDLKAKATHDSYQLQSSHRRKMKKYIRKNDSVDQAIYQSIWLNPQTFKIERIKIREIKDENKKIDAEYSHFKTYDDQSIPTKYDITISAQSDMVIDATLIKTTLNKHLSFPFNIPSKYKEIKMQ